MSGICKSPPNTKISIRPVNLKKKSPIKLPVIYFTRYLFNFLCTQKKTFPAPREIQTTKKTIVFARAHLVLFMNQLSQPETKENRFHGRATVEGE